MAQDPVDYAQASMGLKFPSLDRALSQALSSPSFSGSFEGTFSMEDPSLENLLQLAREFALTPISGFKVGALAIGASGNCYLGANMEFTGVPLHASLHAEQSAIINAWMHGEQAIDSLIVSELPCGHCRQFLLELHGAGELKIVVNGVTTQLAKLIPQAFGDPRPLGQGLLESPLQSLVNIQSDACVSAQRAVNAASRSYTPYSKSPEGFVIETINGNHFAGRAAESVAFNPSVPAVMSALNQLNLSAHRRVPISRCTHAKLATALTHSLSFSEALMQGICNQPVESVLMESAN